ncbi:MAG: aspartate/tyrosine/aromatic aminotransferase [Hyphomicrobiales bacterium]|nr:aspartate/tyrosine/aromatic aminotransferase [Hyphomicrobiales bacterium]
MFESLTPAKPDTILSIMQAFREDKRANKIDLSVGVYKTADGATPIVKAVREAEARLYESQDTKTYLGTIGDVGFNAAMTSLVCGPNADGSRLAAAQTPGGSGALRMIADLIRAARPDATIHAPDPTWANHIPLLSSAGLNLETYTYFDAATGAVNFDAMMRDLRLAKAGDVVLLHGCCHNPTGADLDQAQWKAVGALLAERGLFPLVDLAYLGLGSGLEEDAFGVRHLMTVVPEMAVAVSCSKNFAVYRDRVGASIIWAANAGQAQIISGKLGAIARSLWSMPPDHAAAAVRIVLEDEKLRGEWKTELDGMRGRIQTLRKELAAALNRQSNSQGFDFIVRQAGMFSRLPLTEGQAQRLKDQHAVYVVPDGRINIAGLNPENTAAFAKAYAETR